MASFFICSLVLATAAGLLCEEDDDVADGDGGGILLRTAASCLVCSCEAAQLPVSYSPVTSMTPSLFDILSNISRVSGWWAATCVPLSYVAGTIPVSCRIVSLTFWISVPGSKNVSTIYIGALPGFSIWRRSISFISLESTFGRTCSYFFCSSSNWSFNLSSPTSSFADADEEEEDIVSDTDVIPYICR